MFGKRKISNQIESISILIEKEWFLPVVIRFFGYSSLTCSIRRDPSPISKMNRSTSYSIRIIIIRGKMDWNEIKSNWIESNRIEWYLIQSPQPSSGWVCIQNIHRNTRSLCGLLPLHFPPSNRRSYQTDLSSLGENWEGNQSTLQKLPRVRIGREEY